MSVRVIEASGSKFEKGEGLKIEVGTEGKSIEKWKPDVERIKVFLEGLVGKPFIVVPTSKKAELQAQMGKLTENLEASLKQKQG